MDKFRYLQLIIAVIIAVVAKLKKKNILLWFVLGYFLPPIAIIFLLRDMYLNGINFKFDVNVDDDCFIDVNEWEKKIEIGVWGDILKEFGGATWHIIGEAKLMGMNTLTQYRECYILMRDKMIGRCQFSETREVLDNFYKKSFIKKERKMIVGNTAYLLYDKYDKYQLNVKEIKYNDNYKNIISYISNKNYDKKINQIKKRYRRGLFGQEIIGDKEINAYPVFWTGKETFDFQYYSDYEKNDIKHANIESNGAIDKDGNEVRGGIQKGYFCGVVPVILVYKHTYLQDMNTFKFKKGVIIGYDVLKNVYMLNADCDHYQAIYLYKNEPITVEMLNLGKVDLYVGNIKITSQNIKRLPDNPRDVDIHNWKYT